MDSDRFCEDDPEFLLCVVSRFSFTDFDVLLLFLVVGDVIAGDTGEVVFVCLDFVLSLGDGLLSDCFLLLSACLRVS